MANPKGAGTSAWENYEPWRDNGVTSGKVSDPLWELELRVVEVRSTMDSVKIS